MADLNIDATQTLQLRIAQFKSDPEKLQEVNDFLNEIFDKAKKEVESRNCTKKNKLEALGLQNGSRRIGQWSNRARTQARTFATRIFTTICNCTNTVRSVVVNRN